MRLWSLLPVFLFTTLAWLVFGAVMAGRTDEQKSDLMGKVHGLWGSEHTQEAPVFERKWTSSKTVQRVKTDSEGQRVYDAKGQPIMVTVEETVTHREGNPPISTDITIDLRLDMRRKGLLWFPLYDNDFEGTWTYEHTEQDEDLTLIWSFPEEDAVYDNFRFEVDGRDVSDQADTSNGMVRFSMPMTTGQIVTLAVGYSSRGMSTWRYRPADSVSRIPKFNLNMTTDFDSIDFPDFTLSPSHKERTSDGWKLDWTFSQIVTGHGMGMVMPERIQPGPLVAKLSFSAPISLGLFMVWLSVIGIVKGTRIHWINHLFIAASFFSFHLLFGYSADHIPLEWAFAISAGVSMILVMSYLRIVVSPRFALLEAGVAQLLYLVVFALAHFLEGYTGLTVTVLGIATLAAIMHLTAGIDWTQETAAPASPGSD